MFLIWSHSRPALWRSTIKIGATNRVTTTVTTTAGRRSGRGRVHAPRALDRARDRVPTIGGHLLALTVAARPIGIKKKRRRDASATTQVINTISMKAVIENVTRTGITRDDRKTKVRREIGGGTDLCREIGVGDAS